MTPKRKARRMTERVPKGYRLIREDVCEFLRGAAPLEGYWYGEERPAAAPFWWRKYLAESAVNERRDVR